MPVRGRPLLSRDVMRPGTAFGFHAMRNPASGRGYSPRVFRGGDLGVPDKGEGNESVCVTVVVYCRGRSLRIQRECWIQSRPGSKWCRNLGGGVVMSALAQRVYAKVHQTAARALIFRLPRGATVTAKVVLP